MNNRHKYFRNLRYKQKLEAKYNNGNNHIYFITKEPDTRQCRYLNRSYEKFRGHDYYISWERPEVPYTIIKWHDEYGYKKFCKKYSNRIVRRSKNEFQHNGYRKEFDLWWTID